MNAGIRAEIFARFEALDPDPRTELEHHTPFELLVAVMLSAQATDRSVNLATRELFRVANTPEAIVALGVDGIVPYIRSIGLFPTKSKNVVATARLLLERHDGQVPADREALEALPGVGRKTANVVLNVAFDQATIPVDTHVLRVANRTGIAHGRTPLEVEKKLLRLVPARYRLHCHHWLILHGRYICKARTPECWRCPIADLCEYPGKTPSLANGKRR